MKGCKEHMDWKEKKEDDGFVTNYQYGDDKVLHLSDLEPIAEIIAKLRVEVADLRQIVKELAIDTVFKGTGTKELACSVKDMKITITDDERF